MKQLLKEMSKIWLRRLHHAYLWVYYTLHLYKLRKNRKVMPDRFYRKQVQAFYKPWLSHISTGWHEWYRQANGIADCRYIPETLYYAELEPYFNKREFASAMEDKNFYQMMLGDVCQPKTIVSNISGQYYNDKYQWISKEEAIACSLLASQLVVKPAIASGGGKNVCFLQERNESNLIKAWEKLKKDFIVQEVLEQHPDLAKFHPVSVNTIRLMSFRQGNEVQIVSAVLRMGVNNAKVDNANAGGIFCGIDEQGKLRSVAYDVLGNQYQSHPDGQSFAGSSIPAYEKVIQTVQRLHARFTHFRLISWDFTVTPEGIPVCIEYNLTYQSINILQLANGPLFGAFTHEVLSERYGGDKHERIAVLS